MAPPRLIDYEHLKRLLREHPTWTYGEYAVALTNAARIKNPDAPDISLTGVASAVQRYRHQWAKEGLEIIPDKRQVTYRELIWWSRLPAQYQMDTLLRGLRWVARMRRGVELHPTELTRARNFENELRAKRRVVDVRATGKPYLRAARPAELRPDGELIDIVARPPKGMEGDTEYRKHRLPEIGEESARHVANA